MSPCSSTKCAAERKHRHIVEVGLAVLANASMPLKFWDEAFLTATHLINILPSKVINFDTPFERLLKEKPDYKSLRVFGCACWPNLRPYNTKQLAFRSLRCVFLGYSGQHKGFKCLEPSSRRVYISRDVVFDEAIFPFSELHEKAGARLRKEILLLPNHLLSGDVNRTDPITASCVDDLQEKSPENLEPNGEIPAPNYGTQATANNGVPSAEIDADSPGVRSQMPLSPPSTSATTSGTPPRGGGGKCSGAPAAACPPCLSAGDERGHADRS